MKIIGMVRYSIKNAFAKDHSDINYSLWKEPYFSQRLGMFKNITLKSFDAQTCKDFVLLVYHSDEMPDDKKDFFRQIEQKHVFMRNVFIPDAKMKIPDDLQCDRMMTFRIDNDDGLPNNFIARLSEIYNSKNKQYEDVAFSIPRIRKLGRISDTEYQTNYSVFISNSIGLAYFATNGQNVMDCGNHTLVPYNYRMLCLDGVGGLQIISGTNVANGFNKVYRKQSEMEILNKSQILSLLKSEGYANLCIEKLPVLNKSY